MRSKFSIPASGKEVEIICLASEYSLFLEALTDHAARSGVWEFVIRCIDLPHWWAKYEQDRSAYFTALGTTDLAHDLLLGERDLQEEHWRRYDLCASLSIATCEEARYQDFFELTHTVQPERLDESRSAFPESSAAFAPASQRLMSRL